MPLGGEPIGEAGITAVAFGRNHARAKAVALVENDAAAQVDEIEGAAQFAEDDDGKLQSLAAMHADEADGVRGIGAGRLGLQFVSLLRLDVPEKSEKALSLKLIELSGLREKALKIGPALRAALAG